MKIKISNLRDGEYLYNFQVNTESLDIENIEIEDYIDVEVKLTKTLGSVLTKIDAKGTMYLQCDRCLDPYRYNFETDFDVLFKVSNTDFVTNNINEDVDVYEIKSETQEIDITEPLRDYIILLVPMKKVPDDLNGKCLLCGRNIEEMLKGKSVKEINPVWEKLISLKNNSKNKK